MTCLVIGLSCKYRIYQHGAGTYRTLNSGFVWNTSWRTYKTSTSNIYPPTPSNTLPSPQWLYDLQSIHDILMHSSHNRQICSLKGFTVSAHRLSYPAPPLRPPPSPVPLVKTQVTYGVKTLPSPYRLYELEDILIHW